MKSQSQEGMTRGIRYKYLTLYLFPAVRPAVHYLSLASFFLSVQWSMMLDGFFRAKSSIRIRISNSCCQIFAGIFGRSSYWSCHCHVLVVVINLNQHISWWLTWNREESFKVFLRPGQVHWIKEFTQPYWFCSVGRSLVTGLKVQGFISSQGHAPQFQA